MNSVNHLIQPQREASSSRILRQVGLVLGVATSVLGLVVIFGWHTDNRTLVQLLPRFVPMQYNTALGFVLCGAGLIGLTLGNRLLASIAGYIAVLVGSLTLFEYLAQVELGIDELFMSHDILVKTSHPGRMAPNTAACFTLVGLAIAVWRAAWTGPRQALVRIVLASLAFGLSGVALGGYLAGLETAYGWGNLTRMALHTSVGFVTVSVGLVVLAWSQKVSAVTMMTGSSVGERAFLISLRTSSPVIPGMRMSSSTRSIPPSSIFSSASTPP